MLDFLKKKENSSGLERAKELKLISIKEFWELKIQRAQKELLKLNKKKK